MPDRLDLYCERLDAGFWAEPVNALTNIAFIVAAVLSWRDAQRKAKLRPDVQLLILLLGAIGVGSFLFHTLATPFARLLDIVPILFFTSAFIWRYAHRVMRLDHIQAGILPVLFLITAIIARRYSHLLNGSLIYGPALVFLLALAIYHFVTEKPERLSLLAAAAIFVVSLAFRTMDGAVCSQFALGTHFLWHLLNAAALYLAVRGLLAGHALQQVRAAPL